MAAAWHWYWHQAGGNVLAVPACAVVAVALGYLFRNFLGKRIARFWDRHHGPLAVERHKQALREHQEPGETRGHRFCAYGLHAKDCEHQP